MLCNHLTGFCGCVGGQQLKVTAVTQDASGVRTFRDLDHVPILGAWTSDGPARRKVAKWLAHAAFLGGCGGCSQHGVNTTTLPHGGDPSRAPMHFLGYNKKASGGLRVPGYGVEVKGHCGSDKFWLTHEEQVERATNVDGGIWRANEAGCLGMSPVIQHLDYVRYDRVFSCSVAHAMLLGLVKDFWTLLLSKVGRGEEKPWYSLPRSVRKVMEARAGDVTSTLDHSRPYRCIVKRRGNWVMEDWMQWVEIWSVYILSPSEQVCIALCMSH